MPIFSRHLSERHREAILAQICGADRGTAIAPEAASARHPAPEAPPIVRRTEGSIQEHRRLLPHDGQPIASLDDYERIGGLAALRHVRHLGSDQVIGEISKSGLRGRGGAGFPTGSKWNAVIGDGSGNRFVCCNGAEGEPRTFKDRYLLYFNPYQVLEGLLIAAQVVGAHALSSV